MSNPGAEVRRILPPGESFEIVCPGCRKVRTVGRHAALQHRRTPKLCRTCAGKKTRPTVEFIDVECHKCGRTWKRRSGASKTCPDCKKPPIRNCPVCGSRFTGKRTKKTCSESCSYRLRQNGAYFGGRMFEAAGWLTRTCQACGRHTTKGAVHHVHGHPDHSNLIYVCQGCHEVISLIAHRKYSRQTLRALVWYGIAQRLGHSRLYVQLSCKELDSEEADAAEAMGMLTPNRGGQPLLEYMR